MTRCCAGAREPVGSRSHRLSNALLVLAGAVTVATSAVLAGICRHRWNRLSSEGAWQIAKVVQIVQLRPGPHAGASDRLDGSRDAIQEGHSSMDCIVRVSVLQSQERVYCARRVRASDRPSLLGSHADHSRSTDSDSIGAKTLQADALPFTPTRVSDITWRGSGGDSKTTTSSSSAPPRPLWAVLTAEQAHSRARVHGPPPQRPL